MKRKFALIFLSFCLFGYCFSGQGQDYVTAAYEYGAKSVEMMDLFRLQGTDYYRFSFSAGSFQDKLFEITYAEYRDGQCLGEEKLTNNPDMASLMRLTNNSTEFKFRVIAQKTTPEAVKFLFIFLDRLGVDHTFPVFESNPPYSLRTSLNHSHENGNSETELGNRIPVGDKIPFLIYSLPYEDPDGGYRYCQLTAEGIPPEKWGQHYGVKHYIIFYLRITSDLDL